MTYDIRCIGCRQCEEACPVGAICFSEKGREILWDKCDLCLACASVCPSKAIERTGTYMTVEEVLKKVGESLVSHVRREDFVARLGGDEFGLLASNVESGSAERLVERLRQAVCRELAESDGPTLTASAGLAVHNGVGDIERLFSDADRALRQAKTEGRDRTVAAGAK